MQEIVGGTIQVLYPFAEPVALVCNDEGKLLGLPLNRALRVRKAVSTISWPGRFSCAERRRGVIGLRVCLSKQERPFNSIFCVERTS